MSLALVIVGGIKGTIVGLDRGEYRSSSALSSRMLAASVRWSPIVLRHACGVVEIHF
jgi:hypothetical protein